MRKESLPFNNYNMVKVCDAGNNQKTYVVYRIKVINVDDVPKHRFLELQCNCLTYNPESNLTLEDFIQKNEDRFTTVTKGRNFNEIYKNAFEKNDDTILRWFKNEAMLRENIPYLKTNEIGIYYPDGILELVVSYINNSMDGIFKDYFLEEFGCNEYDEIVDYYGLVMGSEDDDAEILICEGDDLSEIERTADEIFDRLLNIDDDDETQIKFICDTIYEREYE